MGLFDYFQAQGQALPSIEQRRQQFGLGDDYVGSAAQNIALLQRLQGGGAPAPTSAPAQQPATQTLGTQQSGDLFSQYQPRLQAATQKSQGLLGDYFNFQAQLPTFQQKLIDEAKERDLFPNAATLREEYSQNENLTPLAIEALVSRQTQSTRGTIMDWINRAVGGFESDVAQRQGLAQQAQQQRENILQEYQLAFGQQESLAASSLARQRESRLGGDENDPFAKMIQDYLLKRMGLGDAEEGTLLDDAAQDMESPPMSANVGTTMMWPPDSGWIWTATKDGGWV